VVCQVYCEKLQKETQRFALARQGNLVETAQ